MKFQTPRLTALHFFYALVCCTFFTATFASPLLGQEQATAGLSEASKNTINELVEEYRQREKIPGITVAVGVENRLEHTAAFGLADVENNVAVNPDTRFRTASVAKSLTAVLIMSLVEDGKIDLDAEVQTYCPEFPKKKWPVTVKQVLCHQAGIRHYKSAAEALSTQHYFTLSDALETFAEDPLRYEPGTKYLYTSFGYNLLGSVAEDAGGEDFMSLLKKRVLEPAGMQHTTNDDTFAIIKNRSRGYVRFNRAQLMRLPGGHNIKLGELYNAQLHDTSMKIPGGGLLSTSADLVRFASAVNSGKIISQQELLQQMWTSQETNSGFKPGYGLGWAIGSYKGKRHVMHSGDQSGTSTTMVLFPELGVSIAIMCNIRGKRLYNLATRLADTVFEQAVE